MLQMLYVVISCWVDTPSDLYLQFKKFNKDQILVSEKFMFWRNDASLRACNKELDWAHTEYICDVMLSCSVEKSYLGGNFRAQELPKYFVPFATEVADSSILLLVNIRDHQRCSFHNACYRFLQPGGGCPAWCRSGCGRAPCPPPGQTPPR